MGQVCQGGSCIASSVSDAGVDSGGGLKIPEDSGMTTMTSPDGAVETSGKDGGGKGGADGGLTFGGPAKGCGCSVVGRPSGSAGVAGVALALAAALARRRRRREVRGSAHKA